MANGNQMSPPVPAETQAFPAPQQQEPPNLPFLTVPPAALATMSQQDLVDLLTPLDPGDRIRLAATFPDIFQSPQRINLFQLEAANQYQNWVVRSPPDIDRYVDQPVDEGHDLKEPPFLLVAIREGFPADVIARILDAYEAVSPQAVNEIFLHRRFQPPLYAAMSASRLDLVNLLLDRGADPTLVYPAGRYQEEGTPCIARTAHRECQYAAHPPIKPLPCPTFFFDAFPKFRAARLAVTDQASHERLGPAEQCIVAVYRRMCDLEAIGAANMRRLIREAAHAGLYTLLACVVDELLDKLEREDGEGEGVEAEAEAEEDWFDWDEPGWSEVPGRDKAWERFLEFVLVEVGCSGDEDKTYPTALVPDPTPRELSHDETISRRDELIHHLVDSGAALDMRQMRRMMRANGENARVVVEAFGEHAPDQLDVIFGFLSDMPQSDDFAGFFADVFPMLGDRPGVRSRLAFSAIRDGAAGLLSDLSVLGVEPCLQAALAAIEQDRDDILECLIDVDLERRKPHRWGDEVPAREFRALPAVYAPRGGGRDPMDVLASHGASLLDGALIMHRFGIAAALLKNGFDPRRSMPEVRAMVLRGCAALARRTEAGELDAAPDLDCIYPLYDGDQAKYIRERDAFSMVVAFLVRFEAENGGLQEELQPQQQ